MKTTTSESIFGVFDGATSLVGVLAGLLIVHASPHAMLVACAGLAVASAVSMGAGDYLSGKSVRLSIVMGAATFLGSLLPAVPVVLLSGTMGVVLACVLTAAMGVGIAEARSRTGVGRLHGYLSTFAVFATASGLAVAASLLLGVAG